MASFDPTCEIIESNEELTPAIYSKGMQHSEVGLDDILYKHPLLKVGDDPLDDDLNKLFEMIHLKASAKGLGILHSGSASPSSKAALKRPVTVSSSHSPRREISEPVTLKQALRGLCISQAAELAAMKRLSKPVASPRVSEAGRIKNLYMSVVAEASNAGVSTDEKGCKGGTSTSGEKSTKKPENTSLYNRSHYSQFAKTAVQKDTGSIVKQKSSIRSADSSPRFPIMAAHKETGTTSKQKEKSSALTIVKDDHYKRKEPQLKGKNTSGRSLPHLESDEHVLEQRNNFPALTKLPERAPTAKLRRKVRLLQAVSSSSSVLSNGKRVNKLSRNNPRLVKSVTRKNCVKRKPKQDLTSSSRRFLPDACSDDASPGRNQQPICQRCHCALDNLGKEPDGSSLTSASIGGPNNGGFTSKPISTFPGSDGRSIIKFNSNSKSKDKAVFSHSSKSSLGEHSWSTGTSEESILSRPSHYSRPHMSKDVRWKAIQCVRKEHGTLGLSHFNLLKKLGCGDIGTVYLAELISTSCLFAIKVMDTEYLARRKKMPRAQTEREILKMLDHPFLPTLYAQFTSDNLSCLVMEYCPGGDLHVLRQKQPNRNFPEQAARFYVAEVLLALEYLHMLGVVYRDLKPENILVREDGHIMLTDFDLSLRCAVNPTLLNSSSSVIEPARVSGHCRGSNCIDPLCMEPSCRVPCFSPRIFPAAVKAQKQKSSLAGRLRLLPQLVAEPTEARSNSFVGTHEYLAPEIIKGEGHGSAVDWWTFGIFLYELLYGKTPFKGPGNEETLANVVFKSLKFPGSPMVSFQARDLIRGLLAKEPENRLGTQRGAAEIKHHPFFEGLNWALIRCAVPPEIPESYDYGLTTMAYRDTLVEHLDFELF